MIFNSFEFLAFFAVVCPLYWALPHRAQRYLLLAASYAFYMAWRVPYALLLVTSTLVDYAAGLGLERWAERPGRRRALLLLSLSTNLGLLFAFKYWGFFGRSVEAVSALAGHPVQWPLLDVLLPVGISFYTFQTLSYTIDVYRRRIPAEHSLVEFALFVSFFPQLVAGPIERAAHLLPQFRARRRFDAEGFAHGLSLVAIGYYKKMAVGDNLGPLVDGIFAVGSGATPIEYWLGTYAFAFQIYADFSGYSDIAVGLARMLGYDLMANFRTPYFASSPVDFWRRWHVSLSTWLRDYLYIPLGGNRRGRGRTYVNLMATMLLGGLWHGASWTFVVWGGLNGAYLAVEKALGEPLARLRRRLRVPDGLARALGGVITFHLICVSWVFFRAGTLDRALGILAGIGRGLANGRLLSDRALGQAGHLLGNWEMQVWLVVGMIAVDVWVGAGDRVERFRLLPVPLRQAAYSALVLATLSYGVFQAAQFIYFQF